MWNAILQFHFCKRKTSFESFFFIFSIALILYIKAWV